MMTKRQKHFSAGDVIFIQTALKPLHRNELACHRLLKAEKLFSLPLIKYICIYLHKIIRIEKT